MQLARGAAALGDHEQVDAPHVAEVTRGETVGRRVLEVRRDRCAAREERGCGDRDGDDGAAERARSCGGGAGRAGHGLSKVLASGCAARICWSAVLLRCCSGRCALRTGGPGSA
ncbi:hypothetical protein GCM10025865_19260 [Paraoerskovia sediminicola]|uniref:Uncharacterized protein n=1 Tax=Paraoerskovia sediminicola TaxID=1138587 RepID=A0ABN6XCM6_9CELL|nr:hypothetical protein GCM10025865_19260 [Paraoerskovia sediminicola]